VASSAGTLADDSEQREGDRLSPRGAPDPQPPTVDLLEELADLRRALDALGAPPAAAHAAHAGTPEPADPVSGRAQQSARDRAPRRRSARAALAAPLVAVRRRHSKRREAAPGPSVSGPAVGPLEQPAAETLGLLASTPHIGPKRARTLLDQHGGQVIAVINRDPLSAFAGIPGVGSRAAGEAAAAWSARRKTSERRRGLSAAAERLRRATWAAWRGSLAAGRRGGGPGPLPPLRGRDSAVTEALQTVARSALRFALLARQLRLFRNVPFGVSIYDHLPQHHIAALTPPGVRSEFGD
jgi:hypothetical protein